MNRLALIISLCLAFAGNAWAVDRYVKSGGAGCSNPDTDFDPSTGACGSGSSLVYSTIAAALTAHNGGDAIYPLAGTYSEAINDTLKSGTSGNPTKLWAYNGQTVILQVPTAATNGDGIKIGAGKSDISIKGIIVDNANVVSAANGKRGFPFRITGTIASPAMRITLDGVTARNGGIGMFSAHVHFLHITRSRFHTNGHDEFDHGIYTDNGTDDAIIELSEFDNNAQMGAQLYKAVARLRFRDNYVHDNCQITNSGSEIYLSGQDNIVERTRVVSDGSCTSGITVSTNPAISTTRNTVRQVSIYCVPGTCTNGINLPNSSVTLTTIQNSVAKGYTNNLRNLGTTTTLTDNHTSTTPVAADLWTAPTTGNLTLKAGSVLIDGGTAIGGTANGTPDQGTFEVPTFASCEVKVGEPTRVYFRFTNNLKPPMLPLTGVAGVTFRRNPGGGAVSNTPTSFAKATDNEYYAVVTTSQSAGEAIDMSINPATTNLTDSALNGGSRNQPFISTITNQSCTNNLGGAPVHTFTQARYEHHSYEGLEATPIILPHGYASTGAAENFVNYKARSGAKIRTRFAVLCGGADCPSIAFHPWASNGGAYFIVEDTFSANNIKMCGISSRTDIPANGSATTNQLSTAGTFVPGGIVYTANDIPEVTGLNNGFKTELEYCFETDIDATGYFDLRLYIDGGTDFIAGGGAYTVTPRLVMEPLAAGSH